MTGNPLDLQHRTPTTHTHTEKYTFNLSDYTDASNTRFVGMGMQNNNTHTHTFSTAATPEEDRGGPEGTKEEVLNRAEP